MTKPNRWGKGARARPPACPLFDSLPVKEHAPYPEHVVPDLALHVQQDAPAELSRVNVPPRGDYQAQADAFIAEHPEVWAAFVELALRMAATGRKRYSAATIWQVLRWHRDLKTGAKPYRLNNNYHPYFARRFMLEHPEHGELFELRRVRGDIT